MWAKNNNFRLILLTTKSGKNYCDYSFKENDILLFGRESAGVPEKVHNTVNVKLTGYSLSTSFTVRLSRVSKSGVSSSVVKYT